MISDHDQRRKETKCGMFVLKKYFKGYSVHYLILEANEAFLLDVEEF